MTFRPSLDVPPSLRHDGKLTEMGGFIDVLKKSRAEIVPVCAAWAITANRLVRADFERLAGEFESSLRQARPDALLLAMHGAQTAEGEDDVEGFILQRARSILGPDKPIVLSLDLHANITRRMVDLASAIVGYHTYPHVDMFETGQKAARIMLRIVKGELQPRMACRKLPLILQAENSQTSSGPMQQIDHSGAGPGAKRKSRGRLHLSRATVDGYRGDGMRRCLCDEWRSALPRRSRRTRSRAGCGIRRRHMKQPLYPPPKRSPQPSR